jgi:hypothetical protein
MEDNYIAIGKALIGKLLVDWCKNCDREITPEDRSLDHCSICGKKEYVSKFCKPKRLAEIALRGKVYKFDYTKEEYITQATLSGWEPEVIAKYAEQYQPIQADFISDFTSDFCLNSGGFGSGKSLALYIKLILMCKCFPNNKVLLGRKTMSDIERAILPELFELMPASWYTYEVKKGMITFTNGSQIILFGLDAMQSGGIADIKKAQQKLKSLNLGAYFIDQLEEVEYEVIEVLNSRLRRNDVPVRQGNSDCNPANFWAYDYFVANPRPGYRLYQSSMMANPYLPWDYIRKQLNMGEDYLRRFVFGEWNTDILMKGTVFSKENIKQLELERKLPITTQEGCEIFEQPIAGQEYRMGVDPSEGIVDPSSISVVSNDGRKVAKFNGKLPIIGLADKVKFLYYKYNRPLIIPESNAAGQALIREIRDLRLYTQKIMNYKQDRETDKLGFRMSYESKQALITHFQALLRDHKVHIYDRKTIEEMKVFVWSDEAQQSGAGAAHGFHDDDVMSTMLAYFEFNPKKIEQQRVAQARTVVKRNFQYG